MDWFTNPGDRTKVSVHGCGVVYDNIAQSEESSEREQLYKVLRSEPLAAKAFCGSEPRIFVEKLLVPDDPKKRSASFTLQAFAKYIQGKLTTQNKQLMLKIGFRTLREEGRYDNSLETERRIYRQVVNPLIFNRSTPHLTMFYTEIKTCGVTSLMRQVANTHGMKSKEAEEVIQFAKDLRNGGYDASQMRVLVTERAGTTVQSVLRGGEAPPAVWFIVLFQLAWTLICFKDVGLSHNDLHTGNVFITRTKRPIKRYYCMSPTEIYMLESDYMVQIIDYDRSSKMATQYDKCTIINTRLNSHFVPSDSPGGTGEQTQGDCEKFGFCNSYYEKRDIARFMYYFCRYASRSTLQWLRKLNIVDVDEILSITPNNGYAWWGSLCKGTGTGSCQEVKVPNSLVESLDIILRRIGDDAQFLQRGMSVDDACSLRNVWVRPKYRRELKLEQCVQSVGRR